MLEEIGKKIRVLRKAKKISLVELSDKSGVALATLSRIETCKMPGTIESHLNISKALGITLSELYRDAVAVEEPVTLVSAKGHTETFLHGKDVLFSLLTTNVMAKHMMPLLLEIGAGSTSNMEQLTKDAEKFIYCINGKIEMTIAKKDYRLNKADAIYFTADVPHYITNKTKKTAQALVITTPPVL